MSSSSSEDESVSSNKKRKIQKSFQSYWLHDPLFKPWLQADPDSKHKAKCKVCNVVVKAGKSDLQKHGRSLKHTEKLKCLNNNQSIVNLLKNDRDDTHKNFVKKAEIKLSAFFAANNVAFKLIDDLEPLLKEIFPDSKICQDMNLKRTKCVEIIKNVLVKKETDDLVSHLRKNNFSVLLDESTDITSSKTLAVLVRYKIGSAIETRLLQLIELDARNLRATELYDCFKCCLQKFGIPLKNIIGVASDGASVMIGIKHSFFQLLKAEVPHVIMIRCICHSAALIASHACSCLPRGPEDLIRNVYTYISGSSKRSAKLMEIQDFFNQKRHKMLRLSTTRWLSHYECVTRLLENWNVLQEYFSVDAKEDKLKTSERILKEMNNMYTKGYLQFLKYVLNIFNSFNALFQSRKPLIHVLYSECIVLMKQLCKNYLDSAVVLEQNLLELNVRCSRYFKPLKDIYVGPECDQLVKQMPSDGQEIFLKNCLTFYIEATSDLQKRLPDQIFRGMAFLNPSIAFNLHDREREIDFNKLCTKFGEDIDKTQIAIEWRNLQVAFNESEINRLKSLDLVEMWLEIICKEKFDKTLAFPNLGKLVNFILILPHSNAETERIFSIVTDTKTKKRNRLSETSLNAIAVFRSSLQARQLNVVAYEITKKHLNLHNVKMYSFKNI